MQVKKISKPFNRLGIIGRFKPLHISCASMLETLCEQAEQLIIGIGSSNKYNLRNPFTAEETEEMIRSYLSLRFSNYEIIHIPDFGHLPGNDNDEKWKKYIKEQFKGLDAFVSGNGYVSKLLEEHYRIIHPADLIYQDKDTRLRSTEVRLRMARSEDWQALVPDSVAAYLESNKLVERFREEFGQETIAYAIGRNIKGEETINDEHQHTLEK